NNLKRIDVPFPLGRFTCVTGVSGSGKSSLVNDILYAALARDLNKAVTMQPGRHDRIDGLDQSKVSGFTEAQLKKIGGDKAKKDAARAASDASPFWAGGFAWPVTGRVSGVFGSQRILNGEAKTPHSGVDVAAPAGTPIRAPADGIVRLAEGDMYFEGGLIFIDHGQWLESAFLHLSRIDVKPGDQVTAGQVIGAVGATGRATGPHMHWSLKWMGILVDPALVAGEMPQAAAADRVGN
ncbi:MAG TPA: peptidoglycan DD-metalloendopeptidase family protein, partial [Parvularculaceae bacterium]|nr:peptidoglycan DD-metalloendopeptidase family protein [Parvularculaceae bacterium]